MIFDECTIWCGGVIFGIAIRNWNLPQAVAGLALTVTGILLAVLF